MKRPEITRPGIDMRERSMPKKYTEGIDYPSGIGHLDISFFERMFTVDRIVSCKTHEELATLRNDAEWFLELKRLKSMAEDK